MTCYVSNSATHVHQSLVLFVSTLENSNLYTVEIALSDGSFAFDSSTALGTVRNYRSL